MSNIDLLSVTRNIIMEQGATVEIPFAITQNNIAVDLTGYIVRMQVRRNYGDTVVLINCTLANNKLEWIDQIAGRFKLNLAPSDTNASNGRIRFVGSEEELECVYDLELEDTLGRVYKGCRGNFIITREVTR